VPPAAGSAPADRWESGPQAVDPDPDPSLLDLHLLGGRASPGSHTETVMEVRNAPQHASQNVDGLPLGLTGFASVVFIVSGNAAGFLQFANTADFVAPMGMFAGICLLSGAAVMFSMAHTLPATNFGVYGAFWLSTSVNLIFNPSWNIGQAMGLLRIPILVYTFYAGVATLFVSKAAVALYLTLFTQILCLILGSCFHSTPVTQAGGWVGFVCSTIAFYMAASLLLKPYLTLPLGKPFLAPHPFRRERFQPVPPLSDLTKNPLCAAHAMIP